MEQAMYSSLLPTIVISRALSTFSLSAPMISWPKVGLRKRGGVFFQTLNMPPRKVMDCKSGIFGN